MTPCLAALTWLSAFLHLQVIRVGAGNEVNVLGTATAPARIPPLMQEDELSHSQVPPCHLSCA